MRTISRFTKRNAVLGVACAVLLGSTAFSQEKISNFRDPGKAGVNVFEVPKDANETFDGIKVRIGGDFALQYQGIDQTNTIPAADIVADPTLGLGELQHNINLPTANLNIDVQLAKGMRLHLRTYLSSRHHTEAYVKGGYLRVDNLDFITPGLLSGVMKHVFITVGMDQINYGDTQFRRSDNAAALYNPFVGNYLMDSFTTEPFFEITYLHQSGFFGVLGASNGRLNQTVIDKTTNADKGYVLYGKLGYDKQLNKDLRVRLTGSIYSSNDGNTRDYLYGGDRSGARYYALLTVPDGSDSPFAGRINPGFAYHTSIQINPFVKYKGLEFFGVFENVANGDSEVGGKYTQLGAELLYRFGKGERFYVGGRYNSVTGEDKAGTEVANVNRINFGGGFFLTKNVLTKVEYMQQKYDSPAYNGTITQGANISGLVIEAVISF